MELRIDSGLGHIGGKTRLYDMRQNDNINVFQNCAGILKLSVGQLVDIVKTFTATNSTSTKDKIEAQSAFGKFFLGKLWDSHAKFVSKD